jgi:hypothetical protein
VIQWLIPALTGAVIALGAQQGEQQKPTLRLRDTPRRPRSSGRSSAWKSSV